MDTKKLMAFLLMSSVLPVASYAQEVTKKDSTEQHKEVKNRNVMLNASSADNQGKLISVCLHRFRPLFSRIISRFLIAHGPTCPFFRGLVVPLSAAWA